MQMYFYLEIVMNDYIYVRDFEARTMNAWPAIHTVQFDGWILRFADGYTKRANSVNPIYQSTLSLHDKIRECEKIYTSKNLPVIFKLTKIAAPMGLDEMLESFQYEKIDETGVYVTNLDSLYEVDTNNFEVRTGLEEIWISEYCRLNSVSQGNRSKLTKILENIIHPCWFVLLKKGGKTVACGLGVQEGKYFGCFDIVVGEKYRQQGNGTTLMNALLHLGQKNGASIAYLQVMKNNFRGLKLYEKLGFREEYRYWYRKKNL